MALLAGGMLFCVALAVVDPARAGVTLCPLRATTGLLCPFCGGTRALHHLLHGHLGEALAFNPLVVSLSAPAAVFLAWAIVAPLLRGRPMRRVQVAWQGAAAAGCVSIAFALARNIAPWGAIPV